MQRERDGGSRDYREVRDFRAVPRREYVIEPAAPPAPRFNLFDDDGD
jgi:hypothetical protein